MNPWHERRAGSEIGRNERAEPAPRSASAARSLALLLALMLAAGCAPERSATSSSAGPYGEIVRQDLDRLERHAERAGVDLFADLQRARDGDETALARVLAFSLVFSRLDENARTYGHVLHSSLLPLGQHYGLERLSQVVAAQPAPVRQRVRDFFYLDARGAADREASEARVREAAPLLFPDEYVFGAGDSLFRGR